jgi:subtilisin family serine protease
MRQEAVALDRPTRLAVFIIVLGIVSLASTTALAEAWRSPLFDQVYLQVEKPIAASGDILDGAAEHEVLPAEVLDLLGPNQVDYDAFVVTYVPASDADAVTSELAERGLRAMVGLDRAIQLPWHRTDPADRSTRSPAIAGFQPTPVPHMFLVQFAYPMQQQWMAQLEACGVASLGYFQTWTQLVRADSRQQILSCEGIAGLLTWIDSYRVTDRFDPDLLAHESPVGYTLQFPGDIDVYDKARTLPTDLAMLDRHTGGGSIYMTVDGPLLRLRELLASDPDLLSIARAPDFALSDERQGQIIAGNHNGVSPTSPGYLNWLSQRGLLSTGHQQIVAIHKDTGYDDGTGPSGDHHPDLENPERLDGFVFVPSTATNLAEDTLGHGTMIAGIIAGNGAGTGLQDSAGYHYGTGIAPNAKLVMTMMINDTVESNHNSALAQARNYTGGGHRAHIVSNSWNQRVLNGETCHPERTYTNFSRLFDERVLDGNVNISGAQPTTIIFAAGNYAIRPGLSAPEMDSVSAPATAKNVITVGASESYRPTPDPPLSCLGGTNGCVPPDVNATHIARIGNFSGRGWPFGPSSSSTAINTRIKPDLVAPGIRVFSTVPYQFGKYQLPVSGCTLFYPTGSHYTYGTGTSFSAPVVSGVAAHVRNWFLASPRFIDPSPALVKAALIATADTLGGVLSNDHRPSPHYGWGRVNLNRVTEAAPTLTGLPFHINDGPALTTGGQLFWTVRLSDATKPTYIVLAWSDPPSPITSNSQAALINDLRLQIDGYGTWYGNYFNEVAAGVDNGFSYRFTFGVPANDNINNVEAIFIPGGTVPSGHVLTLSVIGMNVTQGSQKFAVYGYNLKQ